MHPTTSTVTVVRKWLWGMGGAGAVLILLIGGGFGLIARPDLTASTTAASIRGSMGLAVSLFLVLVASKALALRVLRWDTWRRCLLDALGLALFTLVSSLIVIGAAGLILLLSLTRQNSILIALAALSLGGLGAYGMLVGLDGWLLGQMVPPQAARRWRVAMLANIIPLLALCPTSFGFTFVLMPLEGLFRWL
jgi:hypothetical protein